MPRHPIQRIPPLTSPAILALIQSVATSLSEKHQNRVFYAFCTYYHYTMKPPGAARLPLGEVSPIQRSRVVGARDHGIKFPVIARIENLTDTTCRSIVKNASHQFLYITPIRHSAPSVLTPGDHRLIRRAIVINPKITAQ